MKRYLLIIPILLFTFLIACTNNSGIPPAVHTAVVQTMTAANITPTITFTPMYVTEISIISLDLNTAIHSAEDASKFDQLERSIGAIYQVMDVDFVPGDSTASSLQLVINCTCAINKNCCSPNRAFVITMGAIYAKQNNIVGRVPNTVKKLVVICRHENTTVGSFSVSWDAVKNFVLDPVNGYQLASEVTFVP